MSGDSEDGPEEYVNQVATPQNQRRGGGGGGGGGSDPPPFDENGYALDDRWIGRGCTFLRQIPRNRLSECLEAVSPSLEAGFTAECTVNGLLCLLWCYTRCKPSVKFTDLRAPSYVLKVNSVIFVCLCTIFFWDDI